MVDSALEHLSKNLLLLPWILKLIVDMVNDSIPLKYTYSYILPLLTLGKDHEKHKKNLNKCGSHREDFPFFISSFT